MANYNAIKYNGFSKGSLVLIKTLTASSSANLSFVNGASDVVLDSTYKEYIFIFNDIHPATDNVKFQVNFRDGETDYDASKTTTHFRSTHEEDASESGLSYQTSFDLAQSTGNQIICEGMGNGADENSCAILHIFDPGNTTFVKHFICQSSTMAHNNKTHNDNVSGYINTTSAVVGIKFEVESGGSFDGIFTLYGVS